MEERFGASSTRAAGARTRWGGGRRAIAAAAAAVVLVAGACGGDDDGAGTTDEVDAAASGDNGATEDAGGFETIAEYLEPPATNGIEEPLSGPAPTGKTVAAVACNVSSCTDLLDAGAEAAAALGWSYQTFVTTGQPEDVLAQFRAALAIGPDAIISAGFPRESIEVVVAEAEEAGVPIVMSGVPDTAEPPYVAVTSGPELFARNAKLLGQWIAADSEGAADVLVVTLPLFAVHTTMATAIETAVTTGCDGCAVEVLDQQPTDIGGAMPGAIVAALQRNPDIGYVALTDGSMATGLSAAIQDAGLSGVKITGIGAGTTNLANLSTASEAAWVAYSNEWIMWAGFDALARHFLGDDAQNDQLAIPTQILTVDNVDGIETWAPNDYQDAFRALWGVG